MAEVLHVQVRQEVGRNAVKKVRKAGHVPAILYGHGQANVNLALRGEELAAALRRNAKLVGLEGYGLHVSEVVPLQVACKPENLRYMKTKKEKMEHRLDLPDED